MIFFLHILKLATIISLLFYKDYPASNIIMLHQMDFLCSNETCIMLIRLQYKVPFGVSVGYCLNPFTSTFLRY
jgi:hypothetical protein